MIRYYLRLSARSLMRQPAMTALMICIMAFGIAATSTTYSVYRAATADPMPDKSDRLFFPQIDAQGPGHRDLHGDPDRALDYLDAAQLLRDHQARYQAAMYGVAMMTAPLPGQPSPYLFSGHAVSSEFFPMLEVPFRYGGSWSAAEEALADRVVVLSARVNRRLFGGHDSVGRSLNLDGHDFRVVGVMDRWNPRPHFYDLFSSDAWSAQGDDLLIPFHTAIAMQEPVNGMTNCTDGMGGSDFQTRLHSSCVWIAMLAQLDDSAQVQAYRHYLDDYASAQQSLGRYPWAPNNRLRDLSAWLRYMGVVPADTVISSWVAISLLLVCLLNATGLMLATFMRRGAEVGVRRALGASLRDIYAQFLCEAVLIGLAGSLASLLLTWLGVDWIASLLPDGVTALARINLSLLVGSVTLGMLASLLAGLYPAYRAARIQPALQLKIA